MREELLLICYVGYSDAQSERDENSHLEPSPRKTTFVFKHTNSRWKGKKKSIRLSSCFLNLGNNIFPLLS